jgi:Zn-finger nucleic acid-binding protein
VATKTRSCSKCGASMWTGPSNAAVMICLPCRRTGKQRNCAWCGNRFTQTREQKTCGSGCQQSLARFSRGSAVCVWYKELSPKENARLEQRDRRGSRKWKAANCAWCGRVTLQNVRCASRGQRPACSHHCGAALREFDLGNVARPWPRAQCTNCQARYVSNRKSPGRCPSCRPGPLQMSPRSRFVSSCCPRCGTWWLSDRQRFTNQERYCSAKCARSDAKDRRRARKRDAFVENVYRREIFERDNWRCHLCGRAIDQTAQVPHPLSATIDHILPLARGGTHEPTNVAAAHFLCNSVKGDRGGGQLLLVS